MVIHKKISPYHPQEANGKLESKILCTILHSTPFNMVYGLDAILPPYFFLPTLQVVQQIEWNGHELSKRLDELEILDETRLRVVAGMYALKHRQKIFHDVKIKNKELQVGDLVVAYTLKQHISKLKKCSMGPHVIDDISTSGALCLAIVDGEKMPNWINVC